MRIIFAMALIAGLSLITGMAEAADPPVSATRTEIIVAFVTAEFDEESTLTGVTLETGEGVVYKVELDRKGRDLGETMNGEWVEAEGLVMERDGALWMTVKRMARYVDDSEDDYYYEEPAPAPDEGWDDSDQLTDEDEGENWEEEEALEDEGDWDEDDDKAEDEETDLP